ncbi:NAD(P)-dependent oxidoreductase [uncultured Roseivirga sp.]|uniref:NAD-dependent epimerase/dehydratase family protein n=1 Tax=uncultured Roseivirga sp. TaxID=543088 RepID=UPI0030DCC4A5|tara:strand:- start:115480 stop:116373 length:894 start_codon:yes stop_codon:yes gene_type:complete
MSKVLVTGGAGFLGSHIADALSDLGHEVTILDQVESPYLRKDQSFIKGDVCDAEKLIDQLSGFEYVYHLAALADLNAAKARPIETVAINIQGTANMLEACRVNNVKRFVFGSTVYVYSREGSFYRCSKQACENYVEEYYNQFGLEYTILRYGSLYGPRTDMANGVYRLLKNFMDKDEMEHSGKSSDKRDYIHAYDAARLSASILDAQYANKNLVLTGNDKLEIADLYKMFGEILGKEVKVRFLGDEGTTNGHYNITPYAYTPKIGHKLVSNEFVDMGQGLIQVIEEIDSTSSNQKSS